MQGSPETKKNTSTMSGPQGPALCKCMGRLQFNGWSVGIYSARSAVWILSTQIAYFPYFAYVTGTMNASAADWYLAGVQSIYGAVDSKAPSIANISANSQHRQSAPTASANSQHQQSAPTVNTNRPYQRQVLTAGANTRVFWKVLHSETYLTSRDSVLPNVPSDLL